MRFCDKLGLAVYLPIRVRLRRINMGSDCCIIQSRSNAPPRPRGSMPAETFGAARDVFRYCKKQGAPPPIPPARTAKSTGALAIDYTNGQNS
jgi:hypothetical protein